MLIVININRYKILFLFGICIKCWTEDEKILKEELIEILKVLRLITNAEEQYQKKYLKSFLKKT